MRSRTLLCAVVVALVVVCAMATAASSQQPPAAADSCATVDALVGARDGTAGAAYKDLVARCATEARNAVAARQAVAATAAKDAKTHPDRALKTLVQQARDLRDAGFDDEARKKVQQIVESGNAVPHDLRPVDSQLGWWKARLNIWGPWVRTVAEILATFVLVVALLRAAYFRSTRKQLRLEAAVDVSPGLVAGMREDLWRLSQRGGSRRLRVIGGAEPVLTVPDSITSVVPRATLVADVVATLGKIVPRREVIAAVSLRPRDATRGLGVTVSIADRFGRVRDQTAIWEADIGGPPMPTSEGDEDGRQGRLLLAAAIWIGLNSYTGSVAPALGTLRWRSYTLFSLGAIAHRAGETAVALRLYRQALDDDLANLGARVNLGSLLLTPRAGEDAAEARLRLEFAELLLKSAAHEARGDLIIVLRTGYMLAVLGLHASWTTASFHKHLRNLTNLVEKARRDPALRNLALDVGQAAKVLRATVALENGDPHEPPSLVPPSLEPTTWYGVATQYNRAVFWARRIVTEPKYAVEDRTRALRELRVALERGDPDMRRQAALDPSFKSLRDDRAFQEIVGSDDAEAPKKPDQLSLGVWLAADGAIAAAWAES